MAFRMKPSWRAMEINRPIGSPFFRFSLAEKA
jgi:hypothetical protein